MKITVIGGSGFIGTNLINRLIKSHNVVNLDKVPSTEHNNITLSANVLDEESLKQIPADTDIIVLLAAEHTDNVSPVSLYYDVNVTGTRNVLQEMDRKNIRRIIFTSSVAIYGLDKDNPNENAPADPFNDYGKSKWQAEEVLRAWHGFDPANRKLGIIRPTVVFGERNRGNVYNLLKQIKDGRFMMIGKGANKKSMSYVENIVSFIHHMVESDTSGYAVYNYADKPDLTTAELVSTIYKELGKSKEVRTIPYSVGYLAGFTFDIFSKITGKKFPISRIRIKKFCATTQFPADRIKGTGFVPPFTLEEGLKKTIDSI